MVVYIREGIRPGGHRLKSVLFSLVIGYFTLSKILILKSNLTQQIVSCDDCGVSDI